MHCGSLNYQTANVPEVIDPFEDKNIQILVSDITLNLFSLFSDKDSIF